MRFRLTLMLALLSASLPLHAQDQAMAPGTRLRVRSPCPEASATCEALVGRLLVRSGDDLLLEDGAGARHRVDLSSGVRLQRSTGYQRYTVLGLGVGALVGLGTGAALAANCTQGGRGEDDGFCDLHYLVAVPAGAGIGALVGALTRSEHWETVSAPRASLRVEPSGGRTTVGLVVGF